MHWPFCEEPLVLCCGACEHRAFDHWAQSWLIYEILFRRDVAWIYKPNPHVFHEFFLTSADVSFSKFIHEPTMVSLFQLGPEEASMLASVWLSNIFQLVPAAASMTIWVILAHLNLWTALPVDFSPIKHLRRRDSPLLYIYPSEGC